MVSTPSISETYMKLHEHLRLAQEDAAMLAHLTRAQSSAKKDQLMADGWLTVSEALKLMIGKVRVLLQGRLN